MAIATPLAIELELDCSGSAECRSFATPLLSQLALGRYDLCSVFELDAPLEEWAATHRTARRRAARADRLGYAFAPFDRSRYVDDVFAVNTSLERRQGRPMTAGYRERPSSSPEPAPTCPRHGVHAYGVFLDSDLRPELVAYAFIYRAGALALVSQILGHGAHLASDVMYLLARGVLANELELGGYLVYNRHDSGTDGLRYYKERVGFEPREVAWTP
jgi:hypothetical protein